MKARTYRSQPCQWLRSPSGEKMPERCSFVATATSERGVLEASAEHWKHHIGHMQIRIVNGDAQ